MRSDEWRLLLTIVNMREGTFRRILVPSAAPAMPIRKADMNRPKPIRKPINGDIKADKSP